MSDTGPVRGLVLIGAPLLPLAVYSWLWAAFDATSGTLGALALFVAMVGVIGAAVVLGWRRQDATAARLGRLDRVWAFRRAVRKGELPPEGVGDEARWRAETSRQLRSTEAEIAGAPWLWVLAVPLGIPVAIAWAAGWDAWRFPAYLPVVLVVMCPLVWWEAVRRRERLRRLAMRLG
ncbi:hypothetical protein [Nocardioides sp. AX2bis]|uniref:hypothetical protein n=1 Tax=Nocardioides sp. AX2bis TaxID=2653157 RepID=UPI0012F152B9|nr:hypothetical protein [Nocardioides sp. AX2bis]VXC40435.1 membrane hypothetical protein [Nocardioides sp. AX2bis]